MTVFGFLLAALALVAGVLYLRRFAPVAGEPRLTDDMVRKIEEDGWLPVEEAEPLDLEEINEEEERFWSETWDEPEEP